MPKPIEHYPIFTHSLEVYDQIPLIPRSYPQCFREMQNHFGEAGKLWTEDRLAAFPFLGSTDIKERIVSKVTENVGKFGTGILTDVAHQLAPKLSQVAGIVFWSEGYEEFQKEKVKEVGKLLKFHGDNFLTDSIVSPNKLADTGAIFRMEAYLRNITGEEPPIVVIEDKITNMINLFTKTYSRMAFNIKEDNLDQPDFDFEGSLEDWKMIIRANPQAAKRYKFLYVPPDKPEDGENGFRVSTLRRDRINRLITETNREFGLAQPVFYHWQQKLDLSSIFTPQSLVVIDIDGPMVSQEKILRSRQKILSDAFFSIVKPTYEDLFQMSFDNVLKFMLDDSQTDLPQVSILTQDSSEPKFMKIGLPALAFKLNIRVLVVKYPPDPTARGDLGKLHRLQIHRYDLQTMTSYYFSMEQFIHALASLNLRLYLA